VAGTVGTVLLVWGTWSLARVARPDFFTLSGSAYAAAWLELGFLALAIGLVGLVFLCVAARVSSRDLLLGVLGLWILATLATGLLLPGASYLFLWPLLFGLPAFGAALAWPAPSVRAGAALLVATLPGVALLAPTLHLVLMAIPLEVSAVAMAPIVPLVGLTVAPLLELAGSTSGRLAWAIASAWAVAGPGLAAVGVLGLRVDADHPDPRACGMAWMLMRAGLGGSASTRARASGARPSGRQIFGPNGRRICSRSTVPTSHTRTCGSSICRPRSSPCWAARRVRTPAGCGCGRGRHAERAPCRSMPPARYGRPGWTAGGWPAARGHPGRSGGRCATGACHPRGSR
jgi:hypothetical protein